MISIEIMVNLLTQFYFAKYLFIASIIYGLFKLVERLMMNK